MNEAKKRRDADKGRRVQMFEESTDLSQAFDAVKDAYIKAWTDSAPEDTVQREKYWAAVCVVDKVRKHLMRIVENGKLAEHDLEKIKR